MRPPSRFSRAILVGAVLAAGLSTHAGLTRAQCQVTGASQWTQSEFMVGVWRAPKFTSPSLTFNRQSFKTLHDSCGVNLIVDLNQLADIYRSVVDSALSIAQLTGIKIVVPDNKFSLIGGNRLWGSCAYTTDYVGGQYVDPDGASNCTSVYGCNGTEECLRCAFEYFAPHPRHALIYGYHLIDEPEAIEAPGLKARIATVGAIDPTRLPFFNLHGAKTDPVGYAQSMVDDPDPKRTSPFLSYDQYPFGTPVPTGRDTTYYRNLRTYLDVAGTRPVWTTVLTVDLPHPGWVAPTNDQIRLSISNPLAYGIRGMSYFYYWPESGAPAILDVAGNPTSVFAVVRPANFYMRGVYGPMRFRSRHLGAFHASSSPTGEFIPIRDRMSASKTPVIASTSNSSALVGVFQDTLYTTVYHLVLANKATAPISTTLSLKGNYFGKVRISNKTMLNISSLSDTAFVSLTATYSTSAHRTTTATISLAAGEARIIRVTGVVDPVVRHLRTDFDGDGRGDISVVDTVSTPDRWKIDYSSDGFSTTTWNYDQPGYGPPTAHTAQAAPGDYDGDGKADLSIKVDWLTDTNLGRWWIDFSANGFAAFDTSFCCYGPASVKPAVGDYDGDGRHDIGASNINSGSTLLGWFLNYSGNGFVSGWDATPGWSEPGARAAEGDYDRDGKTDIAILDDDAPRKWRVDYAVNGFRTDGLWDNSYTGPAFNDDKTPVPGDYDGDGKTDPAIIDESGGFYVDYSGNGFGSWASPVSLILDYYNTDFAPSDYDGDGKWDFAVNERGGSWRVDYAANGFGSWDLTVANRAGGQGVTTHERPAPISAPSVLSLALPEGSIMRTTTRCRLAMPAPGHAQVHLYDARGRLVAVLLDQAISEGVTEFSIPRIGRSGRAHAAGVYFLRASAAGAETTRKLLIL